MSGKVKILIAILVLLLLAAVAFETSAPKVTDWAEGYALKGKRPYDLNIFREQLENLPADTGLVYVQRTPYEYLEGDIAAASGVYDYEYEDDYYNEDAVDFDTSEYAANQEVAPPQDVSVDTGNGKLDSSQENLETRNEKPDSLPDFTNPVYNNKNICYVLISGNESVDEQSQKALMHFVAQGNSVLIINNKLPNFIADTLGLETKDGDFNIGKNVKSWVYGSRDSLSYVQSFSINQFKVKSCSLANQLGAQRKENSVEPNLLSVPFGKGHFYLHSMPILFTNYFMLQPQGSRYVASVLSATGAKQYFFQLNDEFQQDIGDNPLRFILSHPALRWAWYLLLLTLLVFIIFTAKRRQRIVPIINPLENTTVDFTKTIANLYFEMKDHPYVIKKNIIFFLEYLRNKYHVDTSSRTPAFVRQLSERSTVPLETVQKTFSLITSIEQNKFGSEHALIELEKAIFNFKQQENN